MTAAKAQQMDVTPRKRPARSVTKENRPETPPMVGPVEAFDTRTQIGTVDASPQLSKQDLVLGLLRRTEGATAEQIMAATGWQKHSVRGFISGTVKKKLSLTVATEKTEAGVVYRVAA